MYAVYDTGPTDRALDLPREMTQWLEVQRHHSKLQRKNDCSNHKPKWTRWGVCKQTFETNTLLRLFIFFSGGGHYENERDESAGQRSKTVWTGRQSRFLNRFHNDTGISRMGNLLRLCVSKTLNVANCIKLSYFLVFFQIEIKLILHFICQYSNWNQ